MEKEKYIPKRMCVACRQMLEKVSLYKVVLSGEELVIDKEGKMPGRGAYVCKDEKCILLAMKKRGFERAFKRDCSPIYDKLKSECEK